MPISVCDTEPCTGLVAAIESLAVIPQGERRFHLTVIAKSRILKTYYVPLTYCPFCGTRIEPDWVYSFIASHNSANASHARKA